MTTSNNTVDLKTTRRSFALINKVQELNGASLDELTNNLELAKSTVHKHASVLEEMGYLEYRNQEYQVGLKFLNHGEYARFRRDLFGIAKKKITELAKITGAEVDFVAESDGRGITVHESYESERPWHKSIHDDQLRQRRSGIYYHLHCIASGKAILAQLPDECVKEIIDQWGLPQKTVYTITDQSRLFDELSQIRNRGYSISEDEYARGLSAVGMDIQHPGDEITCAIAVSFPTYRLQQNELEEEFLPALRDTVSAIETESIDDDVNQV